jgi:predicted nucleic acid-binding protein
VILVDTSVWIDHLKRDDPQLKALLLDAKVAIHPFIIGELASGNLRKRTEILSLLMALPLVKQATHMEVMHLVERRSLFGIGLGWIDLHLLAAALISRVPILTRDKSLHAAAVRLNIEIFSVHG